MNPRVLNLFIRHLDSIDVEFSNKLVRPRPWSEPALTSLLADLLDENTQHEFPLIYSSKKLNEDLAQGDGVFRVSFKLETLEYTPDVERWVTQSDLGMVVRYSDRYFPQYSWSLAWLLQAKRLTPQLHRQPQYSESSAFESIDKEQDERIALLNKAMGVEFIRLLLYCPRPALLEDSLKGKLAYLRSMALDGHIFDFAAGLELRDDLLRLQSSLAASMFVSKASKRPRSLGEVHGGVLRTATPLSWFLAEHLVSGALIEKLGDNPPPRLFPTPFVSGSGPRERFLKRNSADPENPGRESLIEGIVTGKTAAVRKAVEAITSEESKINKEFPFLPAHNVTIEISAGLEGDGLEMRPPRT